MSEPRAFKFDAEKALAAVIWVLGDLVDTSVTGKLYAILYKAEQAHLAKHGRPIFGGRYRVHVASTQDTPVRPWFAESLDDNLSESDKDCLNNVEVRWVAERVDRDRAKRKTLPNLTIDILDMARAGGADAKMIEFIKLQMENERVFEKESSE